MIFLKNEFKISFNTLEEFVKSVIIGILFSPFQLVSSICRKIMFLKKGLIERMLITSVMIGVVFTILFSLNRIFAKDGGFVTGSFPILAMVIADIILFILFFVFHSMSIQDYAITDFVNNEEQAEPELSIEPKITNAYIDFTYFTLEELDNMLNNKFDNYSFIGSLDIKMIPSYFKTF